MANDFYKPSQQVPPHAPIPLATLLIIEQALCAAWNKLRNEPPISLNLACDNEDPITHALYEVLYDDIFESGVVSGFDSSLFTIGSREGNLRNYNGEEIDKMPDLIVRLLGRTVFKRTQDGLFIECKPIDADHTVGACYCSNGLIRFIDGRYAWAMREALMIGYVSSKYTIIPKLKDALQKKPSGITTLDYPTPCSKSSGNEWREPVYISQHERIFPYVETGENAPPITIRHLWLKRD